MKLKLLALSIMAFSVSAAVNGQGTFTYHFDLRNSTPVSQGYLSESSLRLIGGGSMDVYELFEGLPTGTPVQAGTFGGAPYITLLPGVWGDLEGSFRITVLGGPLNFSGVFIHIATPTSPNPYPFNYYELSTPVPEPAPLTLLILGFATIGSRLWYRKSPTTPPAGMTQTNRNGDNSP